MIERLLETTQPAGRAPRVDERVRDRLVENTFAHVMRAGERCQQSIMREQLERAHVQLAIPAQRVAQSAFRFREGRRVENDEIVFRLRLFRAAQKLKHVLLDPVDAQRIALRISPRSRQTFRAPFHRGHRRRVRSGAGQRKYSLTREAIEHAPSRSVTCDALIMRKLVEVEAGLLRMQEINGEA